MEAKRGAQVGHFLLSGCVAAKVHVGNNLSLNYPNVTSSRYADDSGPKQWTDLRYEHVMKLRQVALESAREMWADYFMVGQQNCSLQAQKKHSNQ